MAKKNDGGGIQQAAGLIRYFDEESEHAWRITKLQVYAACIICRFSTWSTWASSRPFGAPLPDQSSESAPHGRQLRPSSE